MKITGLCGQHRNDSEAGSPTSMTANPGDYGCAATLPAPLTSRLLRVQMPPHLLLQQAAKEPHPTLPAWSLAETPFTTTTFFADVTGGQHVANRDWRTVTILGQLAVMQEGLVAGIGSSGRLQMVLKAGERRTWTLFQWEPM